VELAGLVVSVDRMERGSTEKSALSQVSEEFQMPAFAIVNLDEIIAHLKENQVDGKWVLDERLLERIAAYRAQYGAVIDGG
jgi:orotate phosphoribosyltransferase